MPLQQLKEESLEGKLFGRLAESMGLFLEKWPANVKETGYFEFTTAIREDWAQAFDGVVLHIMQIIETQGLNSFGDLVGRDRSRDWADFVVMEARRHRHRGVTAEMFLVCFKCLIHAVEQIVDELDAPIEAKYKVVTNFRLFLDAMECCFVGDWMESLKDNALGHLQETNRQLTIDKNKYENIFDTTSDLVLVTDQKGNIIEANSAAKEQFAYRRIIGVSFWDLLDLEGGSIDEVLKYYPMDQTYELSLKDDTQFFSLKITHLTKLTKAAGGFMLILSNISCLVDKRERLEELIRQRTMALANSEKQYRALFQAAGEGILLVDGDMNIVKANDRACTIFNYDSDKLTGIKCQKLTDANGSDPLNLVIQNLQKDQIWTGELRGRRLDQSTFPMEVTINCVALEDQVFFHLIVKDITRQKNLEESLMVEKRRLEEMNVTLSNVMKTVDKEKNSLERSISHKIMTHLLPPIEKVRKEPSKEIRESYINILQRQLMTLTTNAPDDFDLRFLRLTRTENKICQLIQAGLSSKEIADNLSISFETIHTHRKNIRKKLGLKGKKGSIKEILLKLV